MTIQNKSTRPTQESGFALVVTITMLILLSLIAVGLLSLSSISIRNSQNGTARAEARANARMALMIAVGELQQYAGPDQRVTATADIAGTALGEPLANGASPENNTSLDGTSKGLSGVQAGTRYWTGVFANNDDPSLIYEKTPSPELLRWLVSSPTDNGNNSDVNPGNSRYQVGNNGSPADANAAIVLVGANTFGNNGGTMDSYVSAPLVPIRSEDGAVRTGAYAWWVGDEGVKSRINISDQTEFPDDYDTLTAQRRGWESTNELPDYPTPDDADQSRLTSIITLPSSELLLGEPQAGQSGGETLFHSASTTSRGLLTNTLEGGLKVDLTTGLVNGLSSSPPSDAYDNYPVQGGRVIPQATGAPFSRLDNLTWDHISDFVKRAENLDGGAFDR